MLSKWGKSFGVLLVMVTLVVSAGFAQELSSHFWMRVYYDGVLKDSLIMGSNVNGSYSLDAALGEAEAPPPPPGGLDIVFLTLPGRADLSWGRGLQKKNLYGFTSVANKDTFIIKFDDADPVGANSTLKLEWSADPSYWSALVDSMFLVDPTNALDVPKVNMLTTSSVEYPAFFGTYGNPFRFRVYRYGTKQPFVNSVRQINSNVPEGFALQQNYPNPFNPTTSMEFSVQSQSFNEIAVYNMLGQKVATLASGDMNPGTYTATWDGLTDQKTAAPSGVYLVRMQSRSSNGAADFSAVRKIVLMK